MWTPVGPRCAFTVLVKRRSKYRKGKVGDLYDMRRLRVADVATGPEMTRRAAF